MKNWHFMVCSTFCFVVFTRLAIARRLLQSTDSNQQTKTDEVIGFFHVNRRFRRSIGFCSARKQGVTGDTTHCCAGRNDKCVVTLFGTTCYCDQFCNREIHSDCCADYLTICSRPNIVRSVIAPAFDLSDNIIGVPSTTSHYESRTDAVCFYNGHNYLFGETTKINCNHCVCDSADNGYFLLSCEERVCLIRPNIVEAINKGGYGWTAENYSFLLGLTQEEGYKRRLGTKNVPQVVRTMNAIHVPDWNFPAPESFDARVKWPDWIKGPRDQKDCGSSWAFTTTSVASDRLRIQSNGTVDVDLSPYHLLSCLSKTPCSGERPDKAWWFLRKVGTVTTSCYPFAIADCNVHKKRHHLKCPFSTTPTAAHVYRSSPAYRISPHPADIKWEIFHNGPVQAVMKVRPDFFAYKSGIYMTTHLGDIWNEDLLSYSFHAVKVIGWGVTKSIFGFKTKFWIAENSWGTDWGEGGYFRIREGESEIESLVLGAWPANENTT